MEMPRLRKNVSNMNNQTRRHSDEYNEGNGVDRISNLPRNVIDDILRYLSIKDIARMSVLSKNWKHVWLTHPILVLDQYFRMATGSNHKNIVNKILLQHAGPIIKFVVDISSSDLNSWDIDHWLLRISTKGTLKELIIQTIREHPYTLPYFLFHNSKLRRLTITCCTFKFTDATSSFKNLLKLNLNQITFDPTMVTNIVVAPLLFIMNLTCCNGIQYLNISAPRLRSLYTLESHCIDLKFLKSFPELQTLNVVAGDSFNDYELSRRFNLSELNCSCPKLMAFFFTSTFFKFVVPYPVPKRLRAPLEHLNFLTLCIQLIDQTQISAVFCLLHSAPQLLVLDLQLESVKDGNLEAVTNYLTAADCIDDDLMALKGIKFESFMNTSAELLLMKILLAHTPSLVKVFVKPSYSLGNDEAWKFYFEILQFTRASPNSKVVLEES